MTDAKKKNIIRCIIWGLLIAAGFLIQSTYGLQWHIGNVQILIMLPFVSCICMFEKERGACWFGLFAGFLLDMVSPSMIGYNALIMLILCTLIGLVSSNCLRNTLLSNLAVGAVFIFLDESLYWLFFIEFKQTAGASATYLSVYLPSILLSIIMIIPVFFIIRAINIKLKPKD